MTREPHNDWNPERYDRESRFVRDGGLPLLQQLAPQPGETILDLGCGSGHLTRLIADSGASVLGVDASTAMLEQARRSYPELRFELARGEALAYEGAFDAVFSNAALHWMPRAREVAAALFRALRPGGRMVVELGGHGNVSEVLRAVNQALDELGLGDAERPFAPWYFPRLGEYSALLEDVGFTVRSASWFPRPSPMPDRPGSSGFAAWLEIFASGLLPFASEDSQAQATRARLFQRAAELAREKLFREGVWWLDYVRLRVEAVR